MKVDIGAATHVGLVRSVNEDSFLVSENLALVADGMGGHARGDLASQLTVSQFNRLENRADLDPSEIRDALTSANQEILRDTAEIPEHLGMGTTICGIALVDFNGFPHWLVFNVGDSRLYRMNGAQPAQLTVDHSEVAELISAGQLTPEEARLHPLRHVITRSLGSDPAPEVDVWIFPPQPDDHFLICSDGLTDELEESDIAEITAQASTCYEAAASLVEHALEAGGRDNITVVLLKVVEASELHVQEQELTIPRKHDWGRL